MNQMSQLHVQTPGIYRRRIGAIQVTALLDGYVDLSNAVWQGVAADTIDGALAARGLPAGGVRNGISSFLLDTGNKRIMVDSGAAGLFGPHAMTFPANLIQAGVSPDSIDEVLITHLHPDHIGALIDGSAPVLPNAGLRVSAPEFAFWTSAAHESQAPAFMRDWFRAARAVVAAYDGRVTTFAGTADLGSGISAVPLPGHTPGHTGFLVESEGNMLLIWGDLAVSAAIQFPYPAASMIFDIDAATGLQSRLRCFDRAASDRLLTAGTHLPFPTFGFVARRGDAFEWIPEEWRYDIAESPLQPVV